MTEAVYEAGSWIYKMAFLLIIAVIAVGIVSVAVRPAINTADLQMDLLRQRILYDPAGIIYADSLGAYPGIIDRNAITQSRIDTAFVYPENYGGAKITLLSKDNTPLAVAIINLPTYERIAANVEAEIVNGGTMRRYVYPVVIADGTDRENGYLIIDIAGPALA
mgnify:CR=1 FL=1